MIGLKWGSLGARSEGNGFEGEGDFECDFEGALAIHSYQTKCDPRFVNHKWCLMLFSISRETVY